MESIYGYCRISTTKQNIDRQERNILSVYPCAHIVKETYTGTSAAGRKEWSKLCNIAKKEAASGKDVTIIFDSVSRMSRNAEEGFRMYEDFYSMGIRLVFLKEPHINMDTYRKAMTAQVQMTGTNADILLRAVNEYLLALAKEVILRNSKDFNGSNTDAEVIRIAGVSRNSYYKYKRELKQEAASDVAVVDNKQGANIT